MSVETRTGARAARPDVRRGSVRPGGRRAAAELPPTRPRVGGGAQCACRGRARPVPAVVLRRRRVAAVVVLGLVLGVLLGVLAALVPLAPAPAALAATGARGPVTTVTVVGGGESLTEVARRVAPGGDEAEVVARIRSLNGLGGSGVEVGRPLVVPVGP